MVAPIPRSVRQHCPPTGRAVTSPAQGLIPALCSSAETYAPKCPFRQTPRWPRNNAGLFPRPSELLYVIVAEHSRPHEHLAVAAGPGQAATG